jgi:protein-tyrosine phosphatase
VTVALSKLNFRDIGGLRSKSGAVVKYNVMYRSEGPASFFDEHRQELRELRIRTVCDLRSVGERNAAPHDWVDPDCLVINADMNTDMRAQGAQAWTDLRENPTAENMRRAITLNYEGMPAALLPHVRAISAALIGGETPMLMHCTAGKDRTGFAVAIYLELAGLSEEDILTDYAKSVGFAPTSKVITSVEETFRHSLGFAPTPEMMKEMIAIDNAHLLAALASVTKQWGNAAGYFEAAGVDAEDQTKIRAALLQA